MKIKDYNEMMKYMTRPGTPEQNKRAEENNKKYLADRRARTRKEYGLPPEDNSQKDMQTWVKNTTALNKNPGAFKKAVEEDELVLNNRTLQTKKEFINNLPIEEQPGYQIDKDPNLLRRIKMYSDNDLGKDFDKAIAEEDKALKKLGRDPLTILQRNTIKKFDNNDPSTYPSNPEQRRKLLAQKKLEDDKPFTKIANNLGKKELKPFKKIPKKSTPIDIPLPDINYNLYMQSKEELFKPDPYLDELKKKVDLAQEQSYQEKVKNNTSGLRSFAPLEVKRDYNE